MSALRGRRQESLGDNLPPMPSELMSSDYDKAPEAPILEQPTTETANLAPSPPPSEPSQRPPSTSPPSVHRPAGRYADRSYDEYHSVMVAREYSRLQNLHPQKLKRRRRMAAGVNVLVLVALTSYFLARYILAWLQLSPSTVPLSASTQNTSADALLRTLAIMNFALTTYSDLLYVLAAVYLRFSRNPSWVTMVIFVGVILAGLVLSGLALANIAVIVAWHKYYTEFPDNPHAATRDVARRCNSGWDLDLIWEAAKSSPIANGSKNSNNAGTGCSASNKTYGLFLAAAGARVAIVLTLTVLFVWLLFRYNQSLRSRRSNSFAADDEKVEFDAESMRNATVRPFKESAELHNLLGHTKADDCVGSSQVPGDWNSGTLCVRDQVDNAGASTSDSNLWQHTEGAPRPRLAPFGWQRGEPSAHEHVYESVPHHSGHAREPSAGGWSAALYRRLWGNRSVADETEASLTAMPERRPLVISHNDGEDGMSQAQHAKAPSKLGVSAWFGPDTGRDSTEASDVGPRGSFFSSASSSQDYAAPTPDGSNSGDRASTPTHQRGRSQELRKVESRHATGRVGDDLPVMPALAHEPARMRQHPEVGDAVPPQVSSAEAASRASPGPSRDSQGSAHQHARSSSQGSLAPPSQWVRSLGRMVQKLPSITSSDERSRDGSDGTAGTNHQASESGGGGHSHRTGQASSGSGQLQSVAESQQEASDVQGSAVPGGWS